MKDRIRKILKETEDEFDWARGFDTTKVEQEIQSGWSKTDDEYDTSILAIYQTLVDAGFQDINTLKEVGEELYDQFESVHDNAKEIGYENGQENAGCDGCCDDYYSYDYVQEQVEEAKESAYDDGFDRGREEGSEEMESEKESEIEELKSTIEELRERIAWCKVIILQSPIKLC